VLRLVAFEGADGKVVWSRNGAEHTCLGIHTDKPRVRCVFTGVVTYSGADASAYTVAALTDSRDEPEDGRYVLSSSEGLLGFEVP